MYAKSYEPEEAVIKQLQTLYVMEEYKIIYDQTKALSKKHPKSVLVNKFLGLSSLKLNNFQDALKTFKKLIELEPNNSDWHLNLGAALQSIGRPQDAVVAIGQSISIKNDNPIAYNNLGNALVLREHRRSNKGLLFSNFRSLTTHTLTIISAMYFMKSGTLENVSCFIAMH